MLEYKKNGRIKYNRNQSENERFWNKVNKTESCWLWLGKPDTSGYGVHVIKGKSLKAHRVSYEKHKGKIPDGMLVRHTCDNPICVNPEHLILGTYKDNAQDRESRGRNGVRRGSKSPLAVITERDVVLIRWLYEQGLSLGNITHIFPINKSTVWGIIKRRSWKHIP